MSVLDRSALEASPLADLHTIASELSIDGYRRLRRAELVAAILAKQGGDPSADTSAGATDDTPVEKPRASRARRSTRTKAAEEETAEQAEESDDDEDEDEAPARRRRGRRGGRARAVRDDAGDAEPDADAGLPDDTRVQPAAPAGDEPLVEGLVELLAGGSGFVRVDPPEPSDDDVYISAAQVKRCELVSGDRVSGPKRAPRRSERFASLIRIETINGRPASELADSVRYDELPAAFPAERIKLGSEDPTVKAIEFLTPFGKGSRVTIIGAPRAGKTEALKRIAGALGAESADGAVESGPSDTGPSNTGAVETGAVESAAGETAAGEGGPTVHLVLAGARPEEITEWGLGRYSPAAAAGLGSSEDVQNNAIEPVIDQARRLAARGGDAIVLIDSLDGCSPPVARKALGAARNIIDGGSLTVIATASAPLGGETTVIALDVELAAIGRFPALDLLASGVLRPELLVGQPGADAIAAVRLEAGEPDDDEA